MKGSSDIKPAETFEYGRSKYIVWNIIQTDNGFEFDYAEVPLDATMDDIQIAVLKEMDSQDKEALIRVDDIINQLKGK